MSITYRANSDGQEIVHRSCYWNDVTGTRWALIFAVVGIEAQGKLNALGPSTDNRLLFSAGGLLSDPMYPPLMDLPSSCTSL